VRVRLAVLQFPLLYCFGVLVGLSVYGADFGSASGYLYVIPLLLAPVVLPRLGTGTLRWLRRQARPLAALGVALGAVAYRPLHLGFWDEQSLAQSVTVSGLGLVSVVVGWLAVTQVANHPGRTPAPLAGALAIVAVFFLLSRWYPLIPILGVALCLAPAVTLRWEEDAAVGRRTGRTPFLSALAFYVAAELGQVVWDLGVDSSWGPQVALAFVMAALVVLFAAGLVSHGIHEFEEAGILPSIVKPLYDITWFLSKEGPLGGILNALFGYTGRPSLMEMSGYTAYLLLILVFLSQIRRLQTGKAGVPGCAKTLKG